MPLFSGDIRMVVSPRVLLFITTITSTTLANDVDVDVDHLPEAKCLSELPMDRLLYIKQAFSKENWGSSLVPDDQPFSACDDDVCPKAEALLMDKDFGLWKRVGYGSGGGGGGGSGWSSGGSMKAPSKSSKKSKILSKLFQSTVTALSFLAFGGYLLCLIVRATRQKEADVNINMNIGARPMPLLSSGRKRKRRYAVMNRWPQVPTELMYQALVMLSEGYATYHQVPTLKNK